MQYDTDSKYQSMTMHTIPDVGYWTSCMSHGAGRDQGEGGGSRSIRLPSHSRHAVLSSCQSVSRRDKTPRPLRRRQRQIDIPRSLRRRLRRERWPDVPDRTLICLSLSAEYRAKWQASEPEWLKALAVRRVLQHLNPRHVGPR